MFVKSLLLSYLQVLGILSLLYNVVYHVLLDNDEHEKENCLLKEVNNFERITIGYWIEIGGYGAKP